MTIRLLESNDYRLGEDSCQRDLEQASRVTEDYQLRVLQDGHTRTLQDQALEFQCAPAIVGLNVDYTISIARITLTCKILCVHRGDMPCIPYLRYAAFKVTPPNNLDLIVTTGCIECDIIPCGAKDTYITEIDLPGLSIQPLVDGNYVAWLWLFDDGNCTNVVSTRYVKFTVSTA